MDFHENDLDGECNPDIFIPEALKFEENSDKTQNIKNVGILDTDDQSRPNPNLDQENLLTLVKKSCRSGPNNFETSEKRREAVLKRYNTLSNVLLDNTIQSDEEFDSDSDSEDDESDSVSDFSDDKSLSVHQKKYRSATDEEVREYRKYLQKIEDFSAQKKHQFDINAIYVTAAKSVDHNDAGVHFDTQQCKPSTSAFRDEPSTSGEGGGTSVVNEANVLKSVEANQKLINHLITMEATLTNELQSLRTEYSVTTKRISAALGKKTEGMKWGCLFDVIHRLGMPYMKDEKYFPAPYNDDYFLKKSRGEYLNHNYDSKPCQHWSRKQRDRLQEAVMRSEIEALVEKTNQEKKLLEMRIAGSDDPEEVETLEEELENLNLRNVGDLKLKDVVGTRERSHDWLRISATDLNGQWTSDECRRMWENYLDPNVNKRKWTEEENSKLLQLVARRGAEDWAGIAFELGTGRSAFVCCSHYQCNLNPRLHNKRFSEEEDNQLKYQIENTRVGNSVRWSKIEFLMAGRNRYQLMARWDKIKPEAVGGRFTEEEDLRILSLAQRHNYDFAKVSRDHPGRIRNVIYRRFLHLTRDWIRGNWRREEDQMILRLIKRHGEGSWKKFEKYFKDRNKSQIRYRYLTIKRHMTDQESKETAESLDEDDLPVVKTRCMRKRSKALRRRHKKLEAKLARMSSGSASKKRERKKNVVFDPGFAEYFKPSYQCRQSLGRRRKFPYPLDEVKVHANTFRSLCMLFSAQLSIPDDDDGIMSEDSLPSLIKQIVVYLRDHPVEPELVNQVVSTDAEMSDSDNGDNDAVHIDYINMPEDEDCKLMMTFNSEDILPIPSGQLGLSYSVLECHYSAKEKSVGIPQREKKAPVCKAVRPKMKQKIPPPVAAPETTPVTIATFTLQANSTELILDSCDPLYTNDILPPANSSQQVTVALPAERPVRKLVTMQKATALRLAAMSSDGSNCNGSVPSTSKASVPDTVPSASSNSPFAAGDATKDATVTNSSARNNSETIATRASKKTTPKPATSKEESSKPATRPNYCVRELAFVRDAKNHAFQTVVTRTGETPAPLPAWNVKLVMDPVPLTGIFSDRGLHHDTLPGQVGLPLQRRGRRGMLWRMKPAEETPECRLPPSVPTLVGYRALVLSKARLREMLTKKYDKGTAVAQGPVSESGRKAHQLWKERCNMLFAFPRYVATSTPSFDRNDFFLSDQSVFLDPDEIRQADDDADDRGNARRKPPTKYRAATSKQSQRQRRTRPVLFKASDSDTEDEEESEVGSEDEWDDESDDESDEEFDLSTELDIAETANDVGDVADDDCDVDVTQCLTSTKPVSTVISRMDGHSSGEQDMPSILLNILSPVEASTASTVASPVASTASTDIPSPVKASTASTDTSSLVEALTVASTDATSPVNASTVKSSRKRKRKTFSKAKRCKKKRSNTQEIISLNKTPPKKIVASNCQLQTSQMRVLRVRAIK